MSSPSYGPTGDPDWRILALIALVAGLLLTGYVVLTIYDRDTTGYVLLVGGPAITSIIGALINGRVKAVHLAVNNVRDNTAAVIDDELPAVHRHLEDQDAVIEEIAIAVLPADPVPPDEPPRPPIAGMPLPAPRAPLPSQDRTGRPQ